MIMFCTLVIAVAMAAGSGWRAGSEHEQAAPPEPFVVTTQVGWRLTGTAARIEIKHLDVDPAPAVEVLLSASDSMGRTWAVHAMAPLDFLETLTLSVQVVDRPLTPGHASIQMSLPGADAAFAPAGLLTLHLQGGRLLGETSGMHEAFTAKFEGPFVVICAVPPAATAPGAPTPTSGNALPPLVIDEKFESVLCQRYAALGGRSH